MSKIEKSRKEILAKLNITSLNAMQNEFVGAFSTNNHLLLLSPTGSGKTLAFLLPIVSELSRNISSVQVLILVPSRELAIQIEQVVREMATGFKVNAFFGGRQMSRDKLDVKHPPAILIGTPGRIADHLRRKTFDIGNINTLVLDEFDKSLEIGFEDEMSEIINRLSLKRKILTSATHGLQVPSYVGLNNPKVLDFLDEGIPKIKLQLILSPEKDKLNSLEILVKYLHGQSGIIFCNFRESIARASKYLSTSNINHGYFHGGMDQTERELSLTKFRNGTYSLLLATDLAARGLDIPDIDFIIHYHLPLRSQEFTHRNGRTARMQKEGMAYILMWEKEALPDFIQIPSELFRNVTELSTSDQGRRLAWKTIMISAGRKDKISKGDIAGFIFGQAGLSKEQVGIIELKQNVAFVAIAQDIVEATISRLNKNKIKKKKVKVSLV